jgi:leader peptidase (prepilin peptidase)/N-methyltransferase
MPRDLSVVRPRSACPACNRPIAAYDNIPVFSWLLLRGKCRHCKAAISPRYAAVELLTGALFVLSYLTAGGPNEVAVKYCVLCFLLIGLVFTDAETQLLPDLLTKPGIALGLLFSLFVPVDGPAGSLFLQSGDWRVVSLINSLAGALFGSAFILGVALLYKAVRGVEGMGQGDVKLMALIGAFLGMKLTLIVLVLGSVIGSLFGVLLILVTFRKRLARRKSRYSEPARIARKNAWSSAKLIFRRFPIPFGVFLGTAAVVANFWGTPMVNWYMEFYR